MSVELFAKYKENPLQCDGLVRACCGVPDDKYYTVSMWPDDRQGEVRVTRLSRECKAKKISKSDQK